MNSSINIDLENGDFVHAWECYYADDDKYIRKIVICDSEKYALALAEVNIKITSKEEFKKYIKFFDIPDERIHTFKS